MEEVRHRTRVARPWIRAVSPIARWFILRGSPYLRESRSVEQCASGGRLERDGSRHPDHHRLVHRPRGVDPSIVEASAVPCEHRRGHATTGSGSASRLGPFDCHPRRYHPVRDGLPDTDPPQGRPVDG